MDKINDIIANGGAWAMLVIMIIEYIVGKTEVVKANSTIEVVLNGLVSLIKMVFNKKSQKTIFSLAVLFFMVSCDKDKAKTNIKDAIVIAATATTLELCQAGDMAAVKKDFDKWITKAMKLDEVQDSANGVAKSTIVSSVCRTAMNILVLTYLPNGGMTPLEWKAQVDCMGMLKEKIASKTCDRI